MKKWLCLMQCIASVSNAMNATTTIEREELPSNFNATTIEMAESTMPLVVRDTLSSCTHLVEGNAELTVSSCWFDDPYHNIRIRLSDEILSSNENTLMSLKNDILEIVDILKSTWIRHGCYVHFPDVHKNIISSVLSKDFEPYEWNRETCEMTYLFDNGRGIPSLDTAFLTGSILIMRLPPDNPVYEVLFIDEPEKMHLTIPAGHVDPGELVQDAVVREVREETGLHLEVKNIKLCHLRNSTGLGNGKQNHVDATFFTFIPYDTVINVDGKEVHNYVWVSADNLNGIYFGKEISPLYKGIIDYEGEIGSPYDSSERKRLIAVNKIPKRNDVTANTSVVSTHSTMSTSAAKKNKVSNLGPNLPNNFKGSISTPPVMQRSTSGGYLNDFAKNRYLNDSSKISNFLMRTMNQRSNQ